ncbi:MAG: FkbM family methyltransferase [Gemmataceae bacterium]|nr:FkbM family methyltransferase [Gemmataceae bacterium]
MPSLPVIIADTLRPIVRRLPLGRGAVIDRLGVGSRSRVDWSALPSRYRVFFDPLLHAWIAVDLAQNTARAHYYTGRYCDAPAQLLFQRLLRPGDTFVDVGAHYGIHSLLAARLVGPDGRVLAFEPSAANRALFQAHVTINHVGNVELFPVALSEEPGTLTLSSQEVESVYCSLRSGIGPRSESVEVVRADSRITGWPTTGRVVIKVDTEGFEYRALRGFGTLLNRANLAVIVECTDEWLRQTGSSAVDLFHFMGGHGLMPYRYDQHVGWRRTLTIAPIAGPRAEWQYDVLFVRPGIVD